MRNLNGCVIITKMSAYKAIFPLMTKPIIPAKSSPSAYFKSTKRLTPSSHIIL